MAAQPGSEISGSVQMLTRPGHDTGAVERTRHPGELPSLRKQDHRGDAADTELGRDRLLLFGIDLEQAHSRFQLCRRLLECRRHHPAGTAPGRPEIDQQRDIAARQLGLKFRCTGLQGLAGEKGRFAAPAFPAAPKTISGDTIYARTMRADDMLRIAHRGLLQSKYRSDLQMGPGRAWFKSPAGLVFLPNARTFPLAEYSEPPFMADSSPYIFEIDENNYEQVVLQGSHQVPVLVDFWASWCQPCKMLMPLLAKLVDEYQGRFILAKINTEEQQAIAAQFGIRSIPTVKLFRDGQPVDEFAGALPESEVRAFLDRHLPRASDGSVVQAEERLQAGDPEGALGLLSQARVEDPHNPRLLTAIAQIQATEGDFEAADQTLSELPADEQDKPEVRQLRAQLFFGQIATSADTPEATARRVSEAPDDTELRYRLAAQQVMADDTENAVENLLLIVQKDRKFGDDAGRIALLKLFDMLGDDPAINRYRARMFNLLH